MGYSREETQQNYSTEELIRIVKNCLTELGVSYEDEPGGFGFDKAIDADVLYLNSCVETTAISSSNIGSCLYSCPTKDEPMRSCKEALRKCGEFAHFFYDYTAEENRHQILAA